MNADCSKVLLIDDDGDLRQLLRRFLVRSGFEVLEAGHGREALNLLRGGAVDLIVTDIIMPDMEGIELILELRRSHPGLPIIAMSAGGRIGPGSYLELARRSGARATITKPFDLREFSRLVDEVLARPPAAAA